jgi:hypothetical protein
MVMNRRTLVWAGLACGLGLGTVAYAEPLPPVGQVITFRNTKSDRCIGVDHASTKNGALVKQFTCDGSLNQKWRVIDRDTLQNVKSGKCLGVDGASTRPGANIGQYNCERHHDINNQSWSLLGLQGSMVRALVNEKTTLAHNNRRFCIGVDHGRTDNGAPLKQFPCDNINIHVPTNQAWQVKCKLCMSNRGPGPG